MSTTGLRILVAGFLLCLTSHALASSVMLVPTSATVGLVTGNQVTFDVVIDFSDVGGTLGGGLDVNFDSNAISLVSVTSAGLGETDFGRDPDNLDGLLESWAVGAGNGLCDATSLILGSLVFEVLPGMGASTQVMVGATDGVAGPWVSGTDFLTLLSPDYNQVQLIGELPEPVFMDGFENQPTD